MSGLPQLALSVRQPWAWAIIHAGKDIENRSWQAVNRGLEFRGRVAIHAAKGMTRAEYDDAADFMETLHVVCPLPADLFRGGIIGSVDIVDVVKESASPWFFGPRGLVLQEPHSCEPFEAPGALGFFQWSAAPTGAEPARWMTQYAEQKEREDPEQECLF